MLPQIVWSVGISVFPGLQRLKGLLIDLSMQSKCRCTGPSLKIIKLHFQESIPDSEPATAQVGPLDHLHGSYQAVALKRDSNLGKFSLIGSH